MADRVLYLRVERPWHEGGDVWDLIVTDQGAREADMPEAEGRVLARFRSGPMAAFTKNFIGEVKSAAWVSALQLEMGKGDS